MARTAHVCSQTERNSSSSKEPFHPVSRLMTVEEHAMAAQSTAFEALVHPANDTPWFPYGEGGCEVQLIQADLTTGQWIIRLRGPRWGRSGGFTGIMAPCSAFSPSVRAERDAGARVVSPAAVTSSKKRQGWSIRWCWWMRARCCFSWRVRWNISIAKEKPWLTRTGGIITDKYLDFCTTSGGWTS